MVLHLVVTVHGLNQNANVISATLPGEHVPVLAVHFQFFEEGQSLGNGPARLASDEGGCLGYQLDPLACGDLERVSALAAASERKKEHYKRRAGQSINRKQNQKRFHKQSASNFAI